MLRLVRHPPRWLRVALAGFMLAFALNSIAHVTHRHDARSHSLHSAACGYCSTFDNVGAAPAIRSLSVAPPLAFNFVAIPATAIVPGFAYTAAQPRAPPLS